MNLFEAILLVVVLMLFVIHIWRIYARLDKLSRLEREWTLFRDKVEARLWSMKGQEHPDDRH